MKLGNSFVDQRNISNAYLRKKTLKSTMLSHAEAKGSRGQLKCDGTRAESRFSLSEKRTCPFKSAVASVQSAIGSRDVRISGTNAGYTMFRGSVKGTGYQFHSPVSPSLPLPCVTVCHHISTAAYMKYVSFPLPPLEAALSLFNFGIFSFKNNFLRRN